MPTLSLRIFVGSVFLLPTLGFAADAPATWPQWRGPTRDGQVTGAAWPDKISDGALKQTWRVDNLGPSYSGPIVAVDRVFTTETVDKKDEVVRCFDRATGKELWKKSWPGSATVPFFAARNGSWIRSTPALEDESLYVGGIRDVLVCLDTKDGSERWRFDFVKELQTPLPAFGCVCSPLLDDQAVYIQAGAALAKINKKTGKLIWKTLEEKGAMMDSAFSSPVFGKLGGKEQILVQTRTKLAGVDKAKGEVLWSKEIPSFRGMNILTPLQFGEGIFTSTYGSNTRMLKVDRSADGTWAIDDAWSFKYEGYMTTPVVVDGHAYFQGKDRRILCVDLKSGKECWRSDKRFGEYWNLVANKDKILALDQDGKLYLLKANPKELEILDTVEVAKSETWAHLAICGNELFIRDLNGLTAYRWKK